MSIAPGQDRLLNGSFGQEIKPHHLIIMHVLFWGITVRRFVSGVCPIAIGRQPSPPPVYLPHLFPLSLQCYQSHGFFTNCVLGTFADHLHVQLSPTTPVLFNLPRPRVDFIRAAGVPIHDCRPCRSYSPPGYPWAEGGQLTSAARPNRHVKGDADRSDGRATRVNPK